MNQTKSYFSGGRIENSAFAQPPPQPKLPLYRCIKKVKYVLNFHATDLLKTMPSLSKQNSILMQKFALLNVLSNFAQYIE
jgi:hypothetical protein